MIQHRSQTQRQGEATKKWDREGGQSQRVLAGLRQVYFFAPAPAPAVAAAFAACFAFMAFASLSLICACVSSLTAAWGPAFFAASFAFFSLSCRHATTSSATRSTRAECEQPDSNTRAPRALIVGTRGLAHPFATHDSCVAPSEHCSSSFREEAWRTSAVWIACGELQRGQRFRGTARVGCEHRGELLRSIACATTVETVSVHVCASNRRSVQLGPSILRAVPAFCRRRPATSVLFHVRQAVQQPPSISGRRATPVGSAVSVCPSSFDERQSSDVRTQACDSTEMR